MFSTTDVLRERKAIGSLNGEISPISPTIWPSDKLEKGKPLL